MKFTIAGILVSLIIYSCSSSVSKKDSKFSEQAMYNFDTASQFVGNKEEAKKKFLSAIDLYRNKKNHLPESIAEFKASILLHPDAKTYFELGNALFDNNNYSEAIQAFKMAEQFDYSPLSNVMYKLSLAHAYYANEISGEAKHDDENKEALHYMQLALQMGYSRPTDYLKDSVFNIAKGNNYEFVQGYFESMSGNKDPQKMLWENFKNEFNKIELPLVINTIWIQQHPLNEAIAYDYEKYVPEMRDAKFSREVENEYYYFANIRKDSASIALMYAGKNTWLTDANGNTPTYFYMVTYAPGGKIIDKMLVAGQRSFTDAFRVLSLKQNYNFEIREYKNIFKDDPEKDGYEHNYVVKSELLGVNNFRIKPDGHFEKINEPLAMK